MMGISCFSSVIYWVDRRSHGGRVGLAANGGGKVSAIQAILMQGQQVELWGPMEEETSSHKQPPSPLHKLYDWTSSEHTCGELSGLHS